MKLTLIRGLPGSGKTTMAYLLPYNLHREADMYFVRPDGRYDFNPILVHQAHAWCGREVEAGMQEGLESIIVSNTFTRKWEMQAYIEMAEKYGYEVDILVARGNYKSVHDVPEEIIARMRERWEE